MPRHGESGWDLVAMNDPSGRRGVWVRRTPPEYGTTIEILELCGGREGDDYHVKLEVGQVVDARLLSDLYDLLEVGAWMCEDHESPPGRVAARRQAEEQLRDLMSYLSQDLYSAGWHLGVEDVLWSAVVGDGRYGVLAGQEIGAGHLAELRRLSDQSCAWWRWDEDAGEVECVYLDEWRDRYERAWAKEREVAERRGGES